MIVGNKSDIHRDIRQVTEAQGRSLANELGCGFIETSARFDNNVEEAFRGMVAEIEKGQETGQPKEGNQKCILM